MCVNEKWYLLKPLQKLREGDKRDQQRGRIQVC
jgi:hypothetical protein